MTEKTTVDKKTRLLIWIKELRAPFFTAVLIPVALGAAVAWYYFRVFDPAYFFLTLIGVVCVNAGTNLANDYFDYKSGCDSVNENFHSPFSGGSGLLPRGVLNPRKVYLGAVVSFGLAFATGGFLAFMRGWAILALGLIGVLTGYFYTTHLATRGIGEFVAGLNCGPLVVLGSFYVQTQAIILEPLIASLPLGILILEVLWMNEIPDLEADLRAGKKTLVTRIGKKRAVDAYIVIMLGTYLTILLGASLSLMPVLTLLALLTVPLALKSAMVARKNYEAADKLVPANAGTVMVHLLTGLLLIAAYVVSGVVGL